MKPFFLKLDRIFNLRTEADSWIGTPWFPNSASKGRGACCHKMAHAIYSVAGFVVSEPPDEEMSRARFTRESRVLQYLNCEPRFNPIPTPEIRVGDLVGFNIGQNLHHVGIYLGDGVFIHAIERYGVQKSHMADATWGPRVAGAWRPME